MTRAIAVAALATLAVVSIGCGSEPAIEATGGARMPKLVTGSDASAMADLQQSATWTTASCRWIDTGAHVLAWPQDTEVLKAARDLGFIEMEQIGTGNRIGTIEPAWRIAITEAGRTEAAKCAPGSSNSTGFAIPVSHRRFISGKRTKEPDMFNPNMTVFEVDFEWVPSGVGDRVRNVLTGRLAVNQGLAKAQVAMLYGERSGDAGTNGWRVKSMNDGSAGKRK